MEDVNQGMRVALGSGHELQLLGNRLAGAFHMGMSSGTSAERLTTVLLATRGGDRNHVPLRITDSARAVSDGAGSFLSRLRSSQGRRTVREPKTRNR